MVDPDDACTPPPPGSSSSSDPAGRPGPTCSGPRGRHPLRVSYPARRLAAGALRSFTALRAFAGCLILVVRGRAVLALCGPAWGLGVQRLCQRNSEDLDGRFAWAPERSGRCLTCSRGILVLPVPRLDYLSSESSTRVMEQKS